MNPKIISLMYFSAQYDAIAFLAHELGDKEHLDIEIGRMEYESYKEYSHKGVDIKLYRNNDGYYKIDKISF